MGEFLQRCMPCGRNYDPAVNKNFNRINGFILFRRHESNKSGNYELGLLSHNSINLEYKLIKIFLLVVVQLCRIIVLRARSKFCESSGRGGFGWVIFAGMHEMILMQDIYCTKPNPNTNLHSGSQVHKGLGTRALHITW